MNALYCDGGVIGRNPSPLGGTWAWCLVEDGQRMHHDRGIIHAGAYRLPLITNNVTEMFALLRGFKELPDGWSGTVYSDSKITLGRVFGHYADRGLPYGWQWAAWDEVRRLGKVTAVLLDGHPTKAQLAVGKGKRGGPVSEWNVFCDRECARLAKEFQAREGVCR